jgi:hypothetical protein
MVTLVHRARQGRITATLTALALLGGALGIAPGVAPGAAYAAAGPDSYVSAFLDQTITIGADGAPGKTVEAWIVGVDALHPTVTFDLSGLAGVAVATFPAGCRGTGQVRTCELPNEPDGEVNVRLPVTLSPAAGAKAGAQATLRYTTAADNVLPTPAQSTVVIGDGVDLQLAFHVADRGTVAPGAATAFPVTFTNRGNRTAHGFTVSLEFTHGIVPATYQNCRYAESASHHLVTCIFTQDVGPGQQVDLTLDATAGRDALGYQSVDITVLAAGDGVPAAIRPAYRPGGAPLRATVRAAGMRAADLDPYDNYGVAQWTVPNTYDVAALGAAKTGKAGATVTATVGVRNNGPGALDNSLYNEPVWHFVVAAPPGTAVTRVPVSCAGLYTDPDGNLTEAEPGKAGYTRYRCSPDVDFLGAGAKLTVTFSMKITKVIKGATGSVSARDPLASQDPDADPANDTARLTVN